MISAAVRSSHWWVDNEKTAVARGAGPWSVLNPAYARYARQVRFHIDPCLPRAPEAKGKVERRILDRRVGCSPYGRHWDSLEELQGWSDERGLQRWESRLCPATGESVLESFARERAHLGPLPRLPEPFDISVTRPVNKDAIVHFESRQYHVPIAFVGRRVEVRGCANSVQFLARVSDCLCKGLVGKEVSRCQLHCLIRLPMPAGSLLPLTIRRPLSLSLARVCPPRTWPPRARSIRCSRRSTPARCNSPAPAASCRS